MEKREWEIERGRDRDRESKILKEKTIIRCFHKRLFHAKISLENPTKSNLLNNTLKFK